MYHLDTFKNTHYCLFDILGNVISLVFTWRVATSHPDKNITCFLGLLKLTKERTNTDWVST